MKTKRWITSLACMLLVAGTIAGIAVAAGNQGTQANPLVTLEYMDNVFLPNLLEQTDKKISDKIDEWKAELQNDGGIVFTSVSVEAGKLLYLTAGSQVILRGGTASSPDPILNLTTGEQQTGTLTVNSLYIALGNEHKIPVSSAAIFLVLGECSVL